MWQEGEYALFRGEQRVTIRGYDGDAMEPFLTGDGRYLLFNNRNEPPQNTDLHYAERVDDLHFDYKGKIKGVDTPSLEGVPSMDRANNLYFISNRSYDRSLSTVYRGRFADGTVSHIELVEGISPHRRGIVNFDAEISGDGNTLYFVDGDFTGEPKPKSAVIVISRRHGTLFRRDPQSDTLMKTVNADGLSYAPAISSDGSELFFTHVARLSATPYPTIYRAVRKHLGAPFGIPERLTGITGFTEGATVSADGQRLYYHKRENNRFVLYLVTRKK